MLNKLFGRHTPVPETTVADVPEHYCATQVQYVDVRELHEWDEARMPGSVHIPLGQLAHRFGELDPTRPVVAVCRSGRRSLDAGAILLAAGFNDVRSLAGGLIAWAQAGRPVERGK